MMRTAFNLIRSRTEPAEVTQLEVGPEVTQVVADATVHGHKVQQVCSRHLSKCPQSISKPEPGMT